MDEWIAWLIVAVVLGVGEVLTLGFYLGPFALGAAAATVVSALGGDLVAAGIVFLAVSTALLVGVRPVARRHMRLPAHLRTGTAALVGRTATVLEPVSDQGGAVKLEGEVWSARHYDEDDRKVIEPGARVRVIEIRGATALVTNEEEPLWQP